VNALGRIMRSLAATAALVTLGGACVSIDDRETLVESETGPTPPNGVCADAGEVCTVNGDCCNFQAGNGFCVDSRCHDSCTTNSECNSNCCVPLVGGGSVCASADNCGGPGGGGAIGDPCSVDADCLSGTCSGLWCTATCIEDEDCFGDNWCIETAAGTQNCFPGCGLDSTKCLDYPGTTCQSATTVEGYPWSVCAL